MYVKEMHIEVRQSLQKIASNKTRKLFDDEIDWLLNKNMDRFIDSKVKPKRDGSGSFEIDQVDLDAIRTLLKSRVYRDAFVADTKRYGSILPGDYKYLVADGSQLKRTCGTKATSTIAVKNLLILPFRKSLAATGPYYSTVKVTINSNVEFDALSYTQARDVNYLGLDSTERIFELIGYILPELISRGYDAYWEYYGDQYYPRSLIIASSGSLNGSLQLDTTTTPGNSVQLSVITSDLPGIVPEESSNALTESSNVADLDGVAFYKSSPLIPTSELSGNILYVYADETFIVSKTAITYVRKPRRISLILGQDCELAPGFHQSICDLTVEYIKAMISDPNWEVKLKDNMVRSTIT